MVPQLTSSETFIVLLGILVTVIYKYLTRNNNFWKDRNVPFEPPMFFFGNYYDLLTSKKCTGQLYRDLYNRFANSRFIGVFQFQKPNLMITDPDDIKRVMISDFNYFQDRIQFANTAADPLSDHLFNVEGETWRPMRQKLSPTFSSGKLRNMFNLIIEVADEFSRYTETIVKNGKEVEVRDMMARYTTDVIGSCGFGLKMESMEKEDAEFRKVGKKIFEASTRKFILTLIRLFDVNFFRYIKLRHHDKSMTHFFQKVIRDIIRERKQNYVKRNDFIDLLLELKDKEQSENCALTVDDAFIASQAFVFFAAGFETSSTLMAFTLYKLAQRQDIQSKVAQEIRDVLKMHDNKITYESMMEMPYLDMVISETQRFYPALSTINRICTTPYTFPGSKLRVEKGAYVVIPVYALHFDPKYYSNPEEFDPERFSNEAKKDRHPMVFLPFGEGPRNCIGLRLGRIQSKVGLVTLLKDYAVEETMKTSKNIKINPKTFVSAPDGDIFLKFIKRNQI